ncbi:transcription initiation factor TFIID subunit 6 [Momordica charantia]|uniref:Transcription initiation factor TFIID subunit 6 n=1 Tax=Momordica charantia TaxID=3673 RepID=A0A6J1C1Y6_MOMCH|nr:transcription initiation factor TFIID subunit 6 [Momordica charantia]XP_022135620.1 transcription initiation factor TFIID subunit 6 [Momordica charantia]
MSIVPKENIEVIAQCIGINNLSPDVALAVAPDVEYRLREVMQEAIKCMRHSKRTTLTADDVDGALNLRNVEPMYGFASGGPLRFKRAVGHRDLFYLEDKDLEFKDVIDAPLPKAPLDTAVFCHWLAIEGVQPAIPENAPVEVILPPSDVKSNEQKDGLPVDIKLPVKHILSKELQLYFDKITELVVSRSSTVLFKKALASLATDSGLHPLVPYFTCFIADEVARGLGDYSLLFALMRVVWSLLQNPHIHIEPYLHQMMPSVVTCLVAKKLGNRFSDNHWELRDFTAKVVALICKRFGHVYNTLQTKLTKTLLNAFLDPKRALTQHYGAIQGLAALGMNVVHLLILPNLEPYLGLLEPEMLFANQKNEMKRHEAWRVYGALLRAVGQCIYDRVKIFPLPSVPANPVLRTNARVITATFPNKRKANADHLEGQPPLKKMVTDGGPMNIMATNSSTSHLGVIVGPATSGNSNLVSPTSSRQMQNEISSGSTSRKGKRDDQFLKRSAVLSQVWKEDLNSGKLLTSMLDLFGESMFCFIPAPELSLFL